MNDYEKPAVNNDEFGDLSEKLNNVADALVAAEQDAPDSLQ